MTNIITTDAAIQATAQAIADKSRDYSPMTVAQMPTRIAAIDTSAELPDADSTVFNGAPSWMSATWADGSWDDIATLLGMHYAGKIDIHDYWNVGDTRTVHLNAMSATGVGESHVAQDVQLMLMSADHYDKSNGTGKAAFVFQQVDLLAANDTTGKPGYMESSDTNANGWHGCARRTWCQNVYKAALPAELQALLKQVNIITATKGNARGTTTSQDYIFLPAEKEIFGTNTRADPTDESSLTRYDWYASHDTDADRVKHHHSPTGSAYYWWERSPNSSSTIYFCGVAANGTANYYEASSTRGLAPCGCI